MQHGVTWLSFLPGYAQLEHYLQQQSHGILFESALSIQHVLSAMLSASVVIIVAFWPDVISIEQVKMSSFLMIAFLCATFWRLFSLRSTAK